jgi:hypothetical protein
MSPDMTVTGPDAGRQHRSTDKVAFVTGAGGGIGRHRRGLRS